MKPKQILVREVYMQRMEQQIREVNRDLNILQARAEKDRVKAELDDIFSLRAMKDVIQRSLAELEKVDEEFWELYKTDLEEDWFDLKISIEKLKEDFEALSFHYSEKREEQLEEFAILLEMLMDKAYQNYTLCKANIYEDVLILCLKYDTAKDRLSTLKKAQGEYIKNNRERFESSWYELRTTFKSVAKQLA